MLLIDKFAYTNKIKHWDPALKGVLALLMIILQMCVRSLIFHIFTFFFVSIVILFVAKIPFKPYYNLLKIPIIFVSISVIPIFLTTVSPDYYVTIWSTKIGFRLEVIPNALEILLRTFASFCCLLFFSLTTPMQKFFARLIQLKAPKTIIEIVALVYRYIFIFLEEMIAIYNAQAVRGGYDTFGNSIKSSALIMKSLVVALFQKQAEMDMYLDARLYEGNFYIGEI